MNKPQKAQTTQKFLKKEEVDIKDDSAFVEYASVNDKNRLFVSKYNLNLLPERDLKIFIENELRKES